MADAPVVLPVMIDTPLGIAYGHRTKVNTCDTCRHWNPYTEEFDISYHGPGRGVCKSEQFVYGSDAKGTPTQLVYWDYEGYSAGFDTGAKFGCVNWTAPA